MFNLRSLATSRCRVAIFLLMIPASLAAGDADRTLSMQSDADRAVAHRVRRGRYEVDVDYTTNLVGSPEQSVQFNSYELGEFEQVRLNCGPLVNPDERLGVTPDGDQQGHPSPPALGTAYRFSLRWELDPQRAEREYQSRIQKFRDDAHQTEPLPDDEDARQEAIEARVREMCIDAIHELRPSGGDRRASRMGLTQLHEEDDQPLETLRALYRWWEFDRLLNEIDEYADETAPDSRRLATCQQILDVLSGELATDQATMLEPALIKKLTDGCRVEWRGVFVPQVADAQPDARWRQAFRVHLGSDDVGAVRWQTTIGGDGAPRSDWLAFDRLGTKRPTVRVRSEPDTVSAVWVTGEGKETFLRVVATDFRRRTPAEIDVSFDAQDGQRVEIPMRQGRPVAFPF